MKAGIFFVMVLLVSGTLAPSLAEPEHEMTTYYMGLIYRGENWTAERTPETMRIQKEHLANISRLAKTGELLLAGPFGDDTDLRGIFVFEVDSLEKAEELVRTDPAVKAGRLRGERG